MIEDFGVGSHYPILASAIARTTGPILECGTGWYSTPMIHLMANGKRQVMSLETDAKWMGEMIRYERLAWHGFGLIDGKTQKELERAWVAYAETLNDTYYAEGVVFLDQSPGEARVPMAKALKGKAKFIVCHDTEADIPPSGGGYGWKQLDGLFKYETIWKDVRPWTTVYSDVEEFSLG